MRTLFMALFAVLAGLAPAQTPLTVSPLPADTPLTISARATPDVLVVELALEPEWHVYARDVGGGQPVDLQLADDGDFRATDAVSMPPDDAGKLTGNVRLELPIAQGGEGVSLRAVLEFTVCDPLACLPPMAVTIAGEVAPVSRVDEPFSVLLVVDEIDDHSGRIEAFLDARGFEVDVTTYADVTAADCEAHDVVVADSKLFGETASVRQQVLRFPRSTTPIVAVGFFGTELIEAQGIAMTSGYI